jgi:hypothetical protein
MFKSNTYGEIELEEIPSKILDYMQKMKHYDIPLQIVVGTDSQNFDKTKVVSVIAVTCEGHGGIFFYEIERIKRINDVRMKLTEETTRSLNIMTKLVEILEKKEYAELRENSTLAIHVDAGWSDKGKTKELIPMLVGWIKACGYDCAVKPASYCASSIADRLSK